MFENTISTPPESAFFLDFIVESAIKDDQGRPVIRVMFISPFMFLEALKYPRDPNESEPDTVARVFLELIDSIQEKVTISSIQQEEHNMIKYN